MGKNKTKPEIKCLMFLTFVTIKPLFVHVK